MDNKKKIVSNDHPQFNRDFLDSDESFLTIGKGELGGKAQGLFKANSFLKKFNNNFNFPSVHIDIPHLVVIKSKVFERFMEINNLYEVALSDASDDVIALAFQEADLPAEIVGDLYSITTKTHLPLAVRSSSILEDSKQQPFAGVFSTKMIANNEFKVADRFHKLIEAVKYVYASTFFKNAKSYFSGTGNKVEDEKMSVIIQEIIGNKLDDEYYPLISGVARSYNYYPTYGQRPDDGIVNLAFGLGKTIVDGGVSWSYSPLSPRRSAPFAGTKDYLNNTQKDYWAVNVSHNHTYDPINEHEYLVNSDLIDAQKHNRFKIIASTYNTGSDRIVMGIGQDGPRLIDFAPLLHLNEYKYNNLIKSILEEAKNEFDGPVEIEFAISTLDENKIRFGLLQVRSMNLYKEDVNLTDDIISDKQNIIGSNRVIGNGIYENLNTIVFVKPEKFDAKFSEKIAIEISEANKLLHQKNIQYLLIGFGRWGSSDPWLGIPVVWSQISNAKVIVETTLENMNVEHSQGSHFFHNISCLGISYFCVHHETKHKINWQKITNNKIIFETEFVKVVETNKPIKILVDGKKGLGAIKYE